MMQCDVIINEHYLTGLITVIVTTPMDIPFPLQIRHWQFPQCSRKDKVLHLFFILSVLLMVTCASLTVVFFKQDKGSLTRTDPHQELTQSEVGNLVCGVLFFVAFFVAIYVEAKSHDTLYKLLVKFIHINQQWYIDEYEKKETPPVAV